MRRIGIFIFFMSIVVILSGPTFAAEDTYSAVQVASNGFGNSNNTEINRMCYFKGNLYAGTKNPTQGCQVWKSADGEAWGLVAATNNGFGDSNNTEIMATAQWRGSLYVSTRNYTSGTEVWATANGSSWSQVNSDGFGSSATSKAREIIGYQNKLFVFTANSSTGGQVWASTNGTSWVQVNLSGFGDSTNTDIASATIFDGFLYSATENKSGVTTGIEIWRYDGDSWTNTSSGGFGDSNNVFPATLTVFDGYLYCGAENNNTIGETWRSIDGSNWERVGQIDGTEYDPVFAPTIVEDSRLYAWGSRSRTNVMDTLYYSMDGLNWVTVLTYPKNDFFDGVAGLSYGGYIYSVSTQGADLHNNLWKLIRNDPNACTKPKVVVIPLF